MSTIQASNVSDGTTTVGTSYVVNGTSKAWVNYNQTVPQIDDSLNVSSVTDSAAGDSNINFTNNMSAAAFGANCGAITYNVAINTMTASGNRMLTYNSAGTPSDYSFIGYNSFGDLA